MTQFQSTTARTRACASASEEASFAPSKMQMRAARTPCSHVQACYSLNSLDTAGAQWHTHTCILASYARVLKGLIPGARATRLLRSKCCNHTGGPKRCCWHQLAAIALWSNIRSGPTAAAASSDGGSGLTTAAAVAGEPATEHRRCDFRSSLYMYRCYCNALGSASSSKNNNCR